MPHYQMQWLGRPTICHWNPPVLVWYGDGLSSLLERCDRLMAEKWQQFLHEAVIRSVKTGKAPSQHRAKQTATGKGPKKGPHKKRKRPAKKGGQPFKQGLPAPKDGGKSDAHP